MYTITAYFTRIVFVEELKVHSLTKKKYVSDFSCP